MSRSTFHSESDLAVAYDTYADAIFRHCYFRTFNRELGKQLMLDTFRETWTFIAEGNCIDDMKMFLYRMADRHIARARSSSVKTHSVQAAAGSSEHRVVSTLQQVPSDDRDAFVLHHIDGLSLQDAAAVLDESADVLRQRVARCMDRIAALA